MRAHKQCSMNKLEATFLNEADYKAEQVKALASGVKRIGLNSIIYSLSGVITRGVGIFLVPLYTRVLTPADYGILAITSTVGNLLVIILSFAIHSSFTRLYFETSSEKEHRSLVGTLLAFLILVPGAFAIGLELVGRAGWLSFFKSVPFRPYLSLTLWSSYFSLFMNLPQTIYITRQQPRPVMGLNILNSLLIIGLSLYFVLYLRQGVVGSLMAMLVAAAIMAFLSVALTAHFASRTLSLEKLKAALLFSLPLVPHLLTQWGLNLSDRFILEPAVPASQLGLYNLGYQVGGIVTIFTLAISNSISPIFIAKLKDPDQRPSVPRLGTFAVAGTWFVGLSIALLGGDAIRLLAPATYHGAISVVPWVVLGFILHGMYMLIITGTFYSMRTKMIPLVTALACIVNIGLNLWLVPIHGIMAAAVNTAIGYGVLLLLHGYLAFRLYPIPWEYRQWIKVFAATVISFAVGCVISSSNVWLDILLKSVFILGVFPIALVSLRFFMPAELALIRRVLLRLRLRSNLNNLWH